MAHFEGLWVPPVPSNAPWPLQVLEPKGQVTERVAEKQLVELLVTPLEKLGLVEILRMPAYPLLMGLLTPATARELSLTICRTMLRFKNQITSIDDLRQYFVLIDLLIQDQPGDVPIEDNEVSARHIAPRLPLCVPPVLPACHLTCISLVAPVSHHQRRPKPPPVGPRLLITPRGPRCLQDFREEQNLVARTIHMLRSDDPDRHMELLMAARTHLQRGGHLRLHHTLRPLCFSALGLVKRLAACKDPKPKFGYQTIYKFLFQTVRGRPFLLLTAEGGQLHLPRKKRGGADLPACVSLFCLQLTTGLRPLQIEMLSDVAQQPEAAMQLLLLCALSASEMASSEEVSFQFVEAALELFEEAISDSKAQMVALQSIVGTLQR